MRTHFLPWLSAMTLALALVGCGGGDDRDPADIPPMELVQSGCEADGDCPGGRCVAGIGEGLCTANCTTQEECPDGTICTDTEAVDGVCLLSCTTGSECTEHLGAAYNCDTETDLTTGADARVCIDGR